MKSLEVKLLIEWLARNQQHQTGSAFLYPPGQEPGPFVYVDDLCTYIEQQTGLTTEEINAWGQAAIPARD